MSTTVVSFTGTDPSATIQDVSTAEAAVKISVTSQAAAETTVQILQQTTGKLPDFLNGLTTEDDVAFNATASLILQTLYWETHTYMYWILITLATLGIIGHLVVVVVMAASKADFLHLSSFRDQLINQSSVDLIACFVLLLHTVIPMPALGNSGQFLCHVWLNKLLIWITLTASTYAMSFFAIERYMELIHHVAHKSFFIKRNFLIVVFSIWAFGFIWNNCSQSSTEVLGDALCVPYTFWESRTSMHCFWGFHLFFQIFLPMCALIFCYYSMHHHYTEKVEPTLGELGLKIQSDGNSYTKKVVMKTVGILSAMFLACSAWFNINWFLIVCGTVSDINIGQYHASVICLYVVMAIKPPAYFLNIYQLETSLKRLVFCERKTWTQEAVKMEGPQHRWGQPRGWQEKPWTPNYTGDDLF